MEEWQNISKRANRLFGGLIALLLLLVLLFFYTFEENTDWQRKLADFFDPGLANSGELYFTDNSYRVVRIVDGDTLNIDRDGTVTTVRLIGIDTPELRNANGTRDCYALEATEKLKELAEGSSVFLELDASQGERDRYGRTLAYVWSTDTPPLNLNLELIRGGFAYEYTYSKAYKYQAEFRAAEDEARVEARGLWGSCPLTE